MKHVFCVDLQWQGPQENENKATKTFKNHHISFQGKSDIEVSAAKAFRGDPSLYNPEELLLGSLISCHMMSYLYCAQKHQLEIVTYQDSGQGFLTLKADGSGCIEKVVLRPRVVVKEPTNIALAQSLHLMANSLCFIANSCNFEIEIQGVCEVQQ